MSWVSAGVVALSAGKRAVASFGGNKLVLECHGDEVPKRYATYLYYSQ
jgi:hypothetical protein